MGAVSSTVIYCSISVHFDLFFYIITVLGVRLKLAFLPPFYKLDLTFVSDSPHPHPAGTPDALYLVPRACCFPPSGGQNVEAAFMLVLPYTLCVVLPINLFDRTTRLSLSLLG
jgi:hypothetical protein